MCVCVCVCKLLFAQAMVFSLYVHMWQQNFKIGITEQYTSKEFVFVKRAEV